MSQKIVCTALVDDHATQDYGTIHVTDIHYEDGSPVTIQKYLGLKFLSPDVGSNPIKPDVSLVPWVQTSSETTSVYLDDKTLDVTSKITLEKGPHEFNSEDLISFEINGNLNDDKEKYENSFEVYADDLPSGIVEIDCAAAPDPALEDSQQIVTLSRGGNFTELSAAPGSNEKNSVVVGDYTVEVGELTDENETIVADAHASPSQVNVIVSETNTIKVTYGAVNKYSALDVAINLLSAPIDTEPFHVKVLDSTAGDIIQEFDSPSDRVANLRRLPVLDNAAISLEVTMNNAHYSAIKDTPLPNTLTSVTIAQSDIVKVPIDISGFVTLPVNINTDLEYSGKAIFLHLISTALDLVYTQKVQLDVASPKFDVPVAPSEYTVQAIGFLDGSTVYVAETNSTLAVAPDGSTILEVTVRKGADLDVRGFPNFLSFGALSDLSDLQGDDFVAAQATSVFKYAGNDGAGDLHKYLDDDPVTTKTIKLAATVEERLGGDYTVLPIMISYTCNFSQGNSDELLLDAEKHMHGFGNLILSLDLAKQDGKDNLPAGYIVNPDFLGTCQQVGGGYEPGFSMPVRTPLTDALAYRKPDAAFPDDIPVQIPDDITDTLQGYVLAVNWLFRTVGKGVTFGWQVNLWGVGSATWIYAKDSENSKAVDPADMAKETVDYIKSLAVYSGKYAPDFLAIDRYEADDFTERAYVNSYCYGPYEWGRFFDFCSSVSIELQVPVAPWQIPASRIPNSDEIVLDTEVEHWGSGGTYIFGDPAINSRITNFNRKILRIQPGSLVPYDTVEDIFKSAQPFDLSYPTYLDFPLRGIFTVLLGGGATTGIIKTVGKTGPWTQDKISAYMESPIPLSTS